MSEFDPRALDDVLIEHLRSVADRLIGARSGGHTLQATALLNEAYLRLASGSSKTWKSRTHFVAVTVRSMRFVLVDRARRRNAIKRGPARRLRVEADSFQSESDDGGFDLLELHDALEALKAQSALGATVVELVFFGGLTQVQAAEVLGTSERTVRREWEVARTWLRRELARR